MFTYTIRMERGTQAGIYRRISDDKAGAGLGVQRQQDDCEKLAQRLGAQVVEVFTDNDTSAYSGRRRPGYEALLDAIRTGKINTVLAWHNDRLHRSPRELEDYIDTTEANNVQTHFCTSGQFDLTTPTGRMIARQVGVMARYESEHKAERISRAHRQGAELGKYRGGVARVFGYEVDGLTARPDEAAAVRDAYRSILEGLPHAAIMRDWHERGIRTSKGNKFSHVSFKNVLLRPRNYGASVYRGEVVGTGQWEPLVDEATWRAVHAIITDPNRKKNHSNRGKYLLGGIMLCGRCLAEGERHTARSSATNYKGDRRTYYVCSKRVHNAIRIEPTDEFVEKLILARLTRDGSEVLAQPISEPEGDDLERDVKALRLRRDELVDMLAAGELNRAQFGRAAERLDKEIADAEREMSTRAGGVLLHNLFTAGDIELSWKNLEWSQKREVINALLKISFNPVGKGYVRRYQPERLQIEWK